jgi:pimeloyl-ACP methyl ester carboxylesterase
VISVDVPQLSEGEITMSDRPTVILVHGFWGDAAHWDGVIRSLSQKGYESLLAVESPLTSLVDDSERTRKMIAQQDGPVLLVGHSYGGAVITEAGNQPNVAGLVYIAAFAPDAGESVGAIGEAAAPTPGAANVEPDSDGYVWIKRDKFHESFCQDLPPDDALVMAVTQKAPLGSVFADEVTTPAWRVKPSWYQISSEDRMIAPENEARMAERIGPRETITLAASHASLASMPAEVADLIDRAARAVSAEPAVTAA